MTTAIALPKIPHEDKSFIEKVFTRIIEREYDSVKDLLRVIGYNVTLIHVNSNEFKRYKATDTRMSKEINFSNMTLELDESRNNTIIAVTVG